MDDKYLLFRLVPTMKCNFRCSYCFVPGEEKAAKETVFDQHPPEEWVQAMKNFSDYEVEFYFWGGEPFVIPGTYELVKGWTAYDHVINGSRIDTNMAFARKIAERCPTEKLKLNCSWHTEYHTLDQIFEKTSMLNDLGMVGMLNFVASNQSMNELRNTYRMTVDDLISKFADIGVFVNIAADFAIANDPKASGYEEYKRFILKYQCPEDWRQLRCEKSPCLCEANKHYFTVHGNGDITPCLSGLVVGNFFEGRLEFPEVEVCSAHCPSLVSYPFRTDNNFPFKRHIVNYVERNREYRESLRHRGGIANPSISVDSSREGIANPSPSMVSIVLPTYNQMQFLPRAVESVLSQTFTDFELIIVNDGSTDGTREYLDSLTDPRVRIIHRENSRLPKALNAGFNASRGELLTWVSSDNYCAPNFLEMLAAALDAHPEAGFAYSAFAWMDDDGRITGIHKDQNVTYNGLLGGNPGVASFMYRRACMEQVGLYDPEVEGAEDLDMWLRIIEKFQTVYAPEVLYYYRLHPQSMTSQAPAGIRRATRNVFLKALARKNNELDILDLYPAITLCRDQKKAEFHACLDFGTRLINTTFDALSEAQKFLEAAAAVYPDQFQKGAPLPVVDRETSELFKIEKEQRLIFKPDNKASTDRPLVSVIVPTYNRPEQLTDTIQSILDQTYPNIEIIVVNDAGEDVEEVINRLNSKGSIRYVRHDENKGLAAARNTGISTAQGKYIAYLDDDDIFYPNHIETLATFLESSGCKVAYTDAHRANYQRTNGKYTFTQKDVPYSHDFDYDRILTCNFIPVLCIMHEKSCVDEVGMFDESFKRHEDWELWVRMSRKFDFAHIKEVTCCFAWTEDGSTMTSGSQAEYLRTMEIIYSKYKDYARDKSEVLRYQEEFLQARRNTVNAETRKTPCAEARKSQPSTGLPTVNTPLKDVLKPVVETSPAPDDCRHGKCSICGVEVEFTIDNPDNLRESLLCPSCQSISRDRLLIRALGLVLGEEGALASWNPNPALRVFETAGRRGHPKQLGKKFDYYNTEYGPDEMQGVYDNRRLADLQKMPYPDRFFDVVLTADVFEHVRLHKQAIDEVYRTLKPGGVMLVQVPYDHKSQKTQVLVQPEGENDIFLAEPQYHAQNTLVYRIYGREFLNELKDGGFEVEYITSQLPELGISNQGMIVCRKPVSVSKPMEIVSTVQSPESINEPLVSIIIPVYNGLKLTQTCLKAIASNTDYPNYEVIVVDNGSKDGTSDYIKQLEDGRIRSILLKENTGFVGACNTGAQAASGDYLLFLNNDTEVQPGWLRSLVDFTEKTPDCGAVGSKLVYPNGRLQEAGGIIFSDGSGWNYGRGGDPSEPKYNFVREVDYCSGAALMVRKELWDSIGGFDTRYAPAYYEDTDLCFEIRKHGYRVYYQPKSIVIHYEGRTAGTDLQSGYKKYQVENRSKFIEKWVNELQDQSAPGHANITKASNRRAKKNILIADPFLPFFDQSSGSLRLFNMLKLLRELDYHITFIARNPSRQDKYRPILEDMGIEVYAGDPTAMKAAGCRLDDVPPIPYEELFKERQFDYAIFSFWRVAECYQAITRRFSPHTKVIVDTIDIHFLREMREAELKNSPEMEKKALTNKRWEVNTYRQADRLWVVTEQDRQAVNSIMPDMPVDVVPNIHAQVSAEKKFEDTKDLLFVGNFNHPPNVDAMVYFCNEVFPLVLKSLPNVKLHIVGGNVPAQVMALASPNVIVTGYVEDLSKHLLKARISISPLRFGAGMKGKVGEALAWGLPVVTTSIGAEGMDLIHNEHALIADDAADFADQIMQLYEDQKLWDKLSHNGRQKVAEWSPEAVKSRLESVFERADSESRERLVSIIILAYNQLDYTKLCLKSIEKHTTIPYELVLVDNGSTDGTGDYFQQFHRRWKGNKETCCRDVKIVQHAQNLGYAAGNNSGIAASDGDYLLLMNNDVIVTPGWLKRMVGCVERNSRVGIVGPVSNAVSGLQYVPAVSYRVSDLDGIDEFSERWAKGHAVEYEPVTRVVGFCALLTRSLVDEIGGLDPRFGLGNFEDDDLCARAAVAGFRCMISKDCFVHHFGSRTFAGEKIDRDRLIFRNWEIFKKKWNLPADLPYGKSFDFSWLTEKSFDRLLHYCPITTGSDAVDIEAPRCWFAAPHWDEPDSWEPLIREYIEAHKPGDGSTLMLYAGRLSDSDADDAYQRVSQCLEQLDIDEDDVPDIEITDQLPDDPSTLIILTGGPMDDNLQRGFPESCVEMQTLRLAA